MLITQVRLSPAGRVVESARGIGFTGSKRQLATATATTSLTERALDAAATIGVHMITISDATKLRHGQTIYHTSLKNADGSATRARITGKCKLWKTRPNDFRIPWKHGLYAYGAVTQDNADEWTLVEPIYT